MRWTRKSILEEIERLNRKGESLSYAAAEEAHLNLVRAAAWHFGTWRRAVETTGINYDALSRYQRWDKERIVQRIREMHHAGLDLSWRAVSLQLDPALAAAALRPNGFSSWRDAIQAAGLDIEQVARYRRWDAARVVEAIAEMHRRDLPLSSRTVQDSNQSLFCAARRRFGSWDAALEAAGLNADEIRLRRTAQLTTQRRAPRRAAKRGKASRREGRGETRSVLHPPAPSHVPAPPASQSPPPQPQSTTPPATPTKRTPKTKTRRA